MTLAHMQFKALAAAALMACTMAGGAIAAEVNGIKFDDTAKVGGKELVLNGLGVRTKFIVKIYATGLYLQEKVKTVPEVMKSEGPRRIKIVLMRDITSDEFGSAFMAGLNQNLDKTEKSKIVTQISKWGEMFAMLDALKKGDVLDLDYIPGSGTQSYLNGKKIGEVAPDLIFSNAILSIWIGDHPADAALKPKLLGTK